MSKAGVITLDLETYRTVNPVVVERVRREAMEKEFAHNTPKSEKETWWSEMSKEQRAAKALDKTAMDVLMAETLCAVYRVNGVTTRFSMMPLEPKTTYEALEEVSHRLDELAGPETVWVGHNVLGFDFPVLLNAWRRNDILPPEHFPKYRGKRWSGRVYDTMVMTPCTNGLGYISLDACYEAMGMGKAKSVVWAGAESAANGNLVMDGSLVGMAYEAGAYDVILDYCEADVEAEEALYLRMTCGGEWGTWDTIGSVAEKVREIESGEEPDTAKRLAILGVLETAGMVPR